MTLRQFGSEQQEPQRQRIVVNIPARSKAEEDEVSDTVRRALNGPIGADVEARMRESLASFKVKLEQHPYVLQRDHKRRFAFSRRTVYSGALAMAATIVIVLGIIAAMTNMMPNGGVLAAADQVIAGVGVGAVKLGMGPDSVVSSWGKPSVQDKTALKYYKRGVEVALASNAVRLLACHQEGATPEPYKTFAGATAQGVKIGSTEEELVSKMGKPDREIAADGANARTVSYNAGVQFVMRPTPGGQPTVSQMRVVPAGSAIAYALALYSQGTWWGV